MSNYDFALDMDTDNSNSLILRNIKPGSRVLEMGSAHGRMTKYLKEKLKCTVYIVELNKSAGEHASKYSDVYWIGEHDGDIENMVWFNDMNGHEVFDHIIFADVLEHLHNPDVVLQVASKLLADDGSILISIPNLGYNGVMIDLLQDKFDYRDYGILDKTHIKFFSYNSLKAFVADAGLTVSKETNAFNTVENSEFNNTYSQLPKEVADYMRRRKYGEVYQFIWELKKSQLEMSIVIPVFNKWNFTKSCLQDLKKLDTTKTEIIVVNNASTDETARELNILVDKMKNLKVIHNETNLGFGRACNTGYLQAVADRVLFLNNDIRVKDDAETWINKIIDACDDNNLVSPTGGKVDPANDFQFLYETTDPNKDINYLSGWCLAAKKSVFDKLIEETNVLKGPFSEKYFCYFEDTHLCFTAARLGIRFKMVSIPVTHFGKISSKQLNTYSLYKDSKNIFNYHWGKKQKIYQL